MRRRVRGFRDDGLDVTGFMMRRQDELTTEWDNIDLGRTYDGRFVHRLRQVFKGADIAAAARDKLAAADVIYARNLDMLATAFLAKRKARLDTPVVYESLDVHRFLTRNDPIGLAFRWLEGALLKRCRRLVVSSPAFLKNHFERHYKGQYTPVLIENRLTGGTESRVRPGREIHVTKPGSPLTIGWVGNLRCARSLNLLLGLADRFGERVRIRMHGIPALKEIPDFHQRIAGRSNVEFLGRYRAPEDLTAIYGELDVVWAGDFMEAGFNSLWLLPNRIYEGGYHAVPPIAPAGTETANWITKRDIGFIASEDLAVTLPQLVGQLVDDRSPIEARRRRLLDLPDDTFMQPRGVLRAMIEDVLNTPSRAKPSTASAGVEHSAPADAKKAGI